MKKIVTKTSMLDKIYYKLFLVIRKLNGIVLRHGVFIAKEHFKNKSITCIEIGVSKGSHMLTLQKNFNIKKIYAIDSYQNHINYVIAHKRLKHFNNIVWLKKQSEDAIDDILEDVDFIYIDGGHSYNVAKKDIELYSKKIKKGGILAGHDFDYSDVAKAVMEFADAHNLIVNTSGIPTDWWIKY